MKNIFKAIRRWQRRNETINALSNLDDRMLTDIGLSRGNINQIANRIR